MVKNFIKMKLSEKRKIVQCDVFLKEKIKSFLFKCGIDIGI